MKRLVAFLLSLIMLWGNIPAYAAVKDNVEICADIWVASSSTLFFSEGTAEFYVSLKGIADQIYITSCSLQIKNNGNWTTASSVSPPPEIYYNANSYNSQYDYSSYLSEGNTYRLVVVYYIDGHTKSCTSNSISY